MNVASTPLFFWFLFLSDLISIIIFTKVDDISWIYIESEVSVRDNYYISEHISYLSMGKNNLFSFYIETYRRPRLSPTWFYSGLIIFRIRDCLMHLIMIFALCGWVLLVNINIFVLSRRPRFSVFIILFGPIVFVMSIILFWIVLPMLLPVFISRLRIFYLFFWRLFCHHEILCFYFNSAMTLFSIIFIVFFIDGCTNFCF